MPSELDSLVIANLREIHAELRGINAKLDDHNRRFDRIERQLDRHRPLIEHTLSVATLNQLKVGKLEAHRDATAAWTNGSTRSTAVLPKPRRRWVPEAACRPSTRASRPLHASSSGWPQHTR